MTATPALPESDRFHALDAARAFALLLGIVLHATMSFFLPIPARDVSQSTTLALVFYVIHSFRMSLFFLIAGFFAHRLLHRRGTRGFVADRAKRILVPMTAGWLLLAPITIAILIWGLSRTFPGVSASAANDAAAPTGFPLTHLWFLYYLCLFYALTLTLRAGFVAWLDREGTLRTRIDTLVGGLLALGLMPVVLAAPLCALLYSSPDWPLWFGIPTPDHGLQPQLPALLGYGAAFGFGWLLHRRREWLDVLRRQWAINLLLASALSTLCIVLIGPTPAADPFAIAGPASNRLLYAAAYTLSIGYWAFGLIGGALRFFDSESPARRYMADGAYWFYLAHLPIVFGLQVWMMRWPLHWSLKFPLIIAITLGLLFASYHWIVRPGFIGEVLNGRRYPRQARTVATSDAASIPSAAGAAPVARLLGVSKRYGETLALAGLDLAVRPGELLAVLGPNGAGKTTAMGLWLGTLQADEGLVELMGGAPADVHSRLGIGVMMQDVNLAPMLSAREHIALAASAYRDPLTVDETVALAGIGTFADTRYHRLSGGQKRQVQFAVAVAGRPRLLFLDEPTVGLDVQAREAMWRTIRRFVAEGRSVVLTTHYLEEAEALADRVAVMAKGRLIAEGSVDEMRALVTRKNIRCSSALDVEAIRHWPGVVDVMRAERLVQVVASDAEAVVRRLLDADPGLAQLEVRQASLAEAFTELTQEAA